MATIRGAVTTNRVLDLQSYLSTELCAKRKQRGIAEDQIDSEMKLIVINLLQ